MYIKIIESLWLLLLVFPVCAGQTGTVGVTILHTTDLHGNILPVTDYDGIPDVGGIVRLAAMIETQKTNAEAVILVDNGDTYQGSIPSFITRGNIVVKALNTLGFDIWNVGNHEFDWGIELLAENTRRFYGTVLSANAHWVGAAPSRLDMTQPYTIKTLNGMRIAFVGVTHPKIPYWSRPVLLGDTVIESPETALMRVMPAIRSQNPDAIVLLAHMGYYPDSAEFEEDLWNVIKLFPDIDVIIGGHTHRQAESVRVGSLLYTQAGYHGISLGRIDLKFDLQNHTLIEKQARLIPVGPGGDTIQKMTFIAEQAADITAAVSSQQICRIQGLLGGETSPYAESPEQTLICEAIAEAVQADVVFHGAFGYGPVISNATLTLGDLFDLIPYENRIVYADLTHADISAVIDTLSEWWGSSYYAFPFGLHVEIATKALPGHHVISITDMNGNPLNPTNRYRTAFNSYMAASGGKRYLKLRTIIDKRGTGITDSEITTRDALTRFLMRKQVYEPHTVKSILTNISVKLPAIPVITSDTPVTPIPVKFSEIGCASSQKDMLPTTDWFALKNIGKTQYNLAGFALSDNDSNGSFRISNNLILVPGEKAVFCRDASVWFANPNPPLPFTPVFEFGHDAEGLDIDPAGDELLLISPDGSLSGQLAIGSHTNMWTSWPETSKSPAMQPGQILRYTRKGWQADR